MRRTLVTLAALLTLTACTAPVAKPGPPADAAPNPPGTPSTAATEPPLAENNPVGDIPDNAAFLPFHPADGTYEIKVPEGWARTTDGATITFTDKLNWVRVETRAAAAPTVGSAKADEVPAIQAGSTRFTLKSVAADHRNGGDIVLVIYEADSPVDPVTGKVVHDVAERYEFWRNGTEAVVTLSGPVGADNVDAWRTISDSFRWLG